MSAPLARGMMKSGCSAYRALRGASTMGGSPSPPMKGAQLASWHGEPETIMSTSGISVGSLATSTASRASAGAPMRRCTSTFAGGHMSKPPAQNAGSVCVSR